MRRNHYSQNRAPGCYGPPRHMKRRSSHSGFGPMMPGRMHGYPLMNMIDDIEDKEEAIEMLEIQMKHLTKAKERLDKRKERLNLLENELDKTASEIGKMKEFSKDDLKKILKNHFKEFRKKMIDLED